MNSPATPAVAQFARAQLLQQQGQLAAARTAYQAVLDADPNHIDTLNAMGVLAGQMGDLPQAIHYFDRLIAVQPDNSGAQCNRGLALKQLGQLDASLGCFARAIELDPGSVIAYYSRAEAYKELGRSDEALASYDQAIAVNSGFLHAFYRRGLVLQQIGRPEEAIASYDRVLQIKPDHFDAHVNRAFALSSLGRSAESLASYDQAIALRPEQASLHSLRGDLLRALGRKEEALVSYDKAIAIAPADAEAHCNRGITLMLMHNTEAISSFDKAIQLKPEYPDPYYHRGYFLRLLNHFDAAAVDYKKVANLAPDFDFLPGSRLEASLQVCDWSEYDSVVAQVAAGVEGDRNVAHPFIFMAMSDSVRLQQKVAQAWVEYACPANGVLGPTASRGRSKKLKIGYFSADFHEHPVARLLAELIEIHDRSRVEVIGFSFGARTDNALQERLARAFDQFIDVHGKSTFEIAALSRSLNVDIAIDLGGHSFGSREGIFALRAAPVQVNYLGYLGTLGADYIDYIVADAVVITPETECHYTEKVIYLPDTHQVNDRTRVIADKVFTRDELRLPQSGFVFCCFNSGYKIQPATFASWMRILKTVPESVLLLYAAYEPIQANLCAQAAKHGVDPRRLVFGERMNPPEYLARYRAADLFLDTFPYTAGATASDALWAGLPVLTLTGKAFVSRTAASLLTAIGAPELITSTQQAYEQLAIELASNPQCLAEIRAKIARNRLSCSLFDTPRFARNLESAYQAIHDRYQAGLPPDHIRI